MQKKNGGHYERRARLVQAADGKPCRRPEGVARIAVTRELNVILVINKMTSVGGLAER